MASLQLPRGRCGGQNEKTSRKDPQRQARVKIAGVVGLGEIGENEVEEFDGGRGESDEGQG